MWKVEITEGWYLTPNPEGTGLLLCVERSLKAHTQVVSAYVSRTPQQIDVENHLLSCPPGRPETYGALYASVIGKLEALATELFDLGWFHHTEQIGLTTHYTILRAISRESEKLHHARTGN